jgi:hypothetical protein
MSLVADFLPQAVKELLERLPNVAQAVADFPLLEALFGHHQVVPGRVELHEDSLRVDRLWNWIMPSLLTGAITIDYWRALGLLILCRILFGGFRGHGHGSWQEKREHWQHWQAMTPEEREQFHKHRADRCRPLKTEEKQDD